MRLPHFLVIGAMKAGTTTLFSDLRSNKAIFLAEKELSGLASSETVACYAAGFRRAGKHHVIGDISASYAMLPQSHSVVSNAMRFLSDTTKVIYLVRDPIARTLSHHNHMTTWVGEDRMGLDINVEINNRPELIDYSRYSMQLEPWINAFGASAIKVIKFEEYIAERCAVIADLSHFIGVSANLNRIAPHRIYNPSAGKPLAIGWWQRLRLSPVYRNIIRPFTTLPMRNALRGLVLPRASDGARVPPTEQTLDLIIEQVSSDVAALSNFMGRDVPLWDLNASKARHLTLGQQ